MSCFVGLVAFIGPAQSVQDHATRTEVKLPRVFAHAGTPTRGSQNGDKTWFILSFMRRRLD